MKKFLFKGVSVLGAILLLATSVMPGLQYAYAESYPTDAPIWDYIHDEGSWNASYSEGGLNGYYEWSDKVNAPYKEDLWNTLANRAANINDAKVGDEGHGTDDEGRTLDENGSYVYEHCERSWQGAVNAPGAKYPWAVLNLPESSEGTIEFIYDGGEPVYPWGKATRSYNKGYGGAASIPTELGEGFLLTAGETTFDPTKLTVTLLAPVACIMAGETSAETDVCYPSLRVAIEKASEGDTIYLVDDDEVSLRVDNPELVIDKNIIIDGKKDDDHNYTILGISEWESNVTGGHFGLKVTAAGEVTIKNVDMKNFGDKYYVNKHMFAPIIAEGTSTSKLTLDNVNIEKFNREAIVIKQGTYDIKNGIITAGADNEGIQKDQFQQPIEIRTTVDGGGIIDNMNISGVMRSQFSLTDESPKGAWVAGGIVVYNNCEATITNTTITTENQNYVAAIINDGKSVTLDGDNHITGKHALFFDENGKSFVINGGEYDGLLTKLEVNANLFEINGGIFSEEPDNSYLKVDKCALKNNDNKYEIGTCPEPVIFYSSSHNKIPVIIDENGSINLDGTKIAIKNEGKRDTPALSTETTKILAAESSDGLEIIEIEGEKVLFMNMSEFGGGSQTKGFSSVDESGIFFAKFQGGTNYDAEAISYDESAILKPKWVTTEGKTVEKYNVITKEEKEIGYTLKIGTPDFSWFYAPKTYKVTFHDPDGKNTDVVVSQGYGTTITAPTWTKNGYTLSWDKTVSTMPAEDTTVNAVWKAKPASYSGGGGGGSSRTTTTDDTAKTETGSTVDTTDKVDSTDTTNPDSESKEGTDGSKAETYSDELVAAYKWAFGQGITTMPTIQKAKLNDSITREQLAKMMVQFMSKVLDKKPIKTDTPDYEDVKVETRGQEMYDFVTLAYQYQIMGIDANGNALKKFKPTGTVSRAEFATVLSRVLFGSAYNQNSGNYRELHIQALNTAGILNNTNPTITELRGWILLMLYRSRDVKIELKAKDTPVAEAPAEETTPAAQSDESKGEESEGTGAMIGMPNPASVYCEEQGGTLSIVKDAEGNESGMCKLADGTEVEEWAYYRANHADEAASTQEAKPAEESSTTTEETKSE